MTISKTEELIRNKPIRVDSARVKKDPDNFQFSTVEIRFSYTPDQRAYSLKTTRHFYAYDYCAVNVEIILEGLKEYCIIESYDLDDQELTYEDSFNTGAEIVDNTTTDDISTYIKENACNLSCALQWAVQRKLSHLRAAETFSVKKVLRAKKQRV